jgi:hypothetical protein
VTPQTDVLAALNELTSAEIERRIVDLRGQEAMLRTLLRAKLAQARAERRLTEEAPDR